MSRLVAVLNYLFLNQQLRVQFMLIFYLLFLPILGVVTRTLLGKMDKGEIGETLQTAGSNVGVNSCVRVYV